MRYTISLAMASLAATTAVAEVPRVVTDIPPVHSLVAQVMGDLGAPVLLLEPGADEHSFQLRPSQAAALNDASVVFWIGPDLTPWLERALETAPDTVGRVALLGAGGSATRDYATDEAEHAEGEGAEHAEGEAQDHDAEHDHEAEAGAAEGTHDHEEEHDHAHGGVDPHAWLAPANATVWVGVIAAELARLDPENAATYAANAATATAVIAAADAKTRATLAPLADRPFVVFHDAYGYFVDSYGLTLAGAVAEGDAADPGAARVAALRDMVAAGGAVCLFPEAQHDPALLAQMTEGTVARIGGALDPVGSTLEPGPQMYGALLTGMAATIATCLAGG